MTLMRKKKLTFLFITFALLFIFGVGGVVYKNIGALSKNEKPRYLGSDKLSEEGYEVAKEEFLKSVNDKDPAIALAELRERVKRDDSLLRSCHALVHEVGRASYEKYRDFGEAMKYEDEICNSGYLHGVIEAHFSKAPDVFAAIKTVCDPYLPETFLSWECYHGIGHGVMYYTSNDLPRSLGMCDSYDSDFARATCANGVFMENFNSDQKLHPSKFLKSDDPFYPCAEQATRHKRDCYLYAPAYYLGLKENDYVGALKWCDGAEVPYKSACAQGVGSQAIKENINNPKFVEEICASNELTQRAPCIDGMVRLYINHHGSLAPAKILCGQLKPSNRQTCYFSVQSNSGLFTN